MPGYMHPCRYCNQLTPPDANVCPACGKVNPTAMRCPRCRSPIRPGWKNCGHCGLPLETACPECGQATFFGDYCQHCEARLVVICPNPKCRAEQPPLGGNCVKCGKPMRRQQ